MQERGRGAGGRRQERLHIVKVAVGEVTPWRGGEGGWHETFLSIMHIQHS